MTVLRMTQMPRTSRYLWLGLALWGAALLGGCAVEPNTLAKDPYEAANRRVFSFNEGLDASIIQPAAKAYTTVVPDPLQNAFANFTNNIKDVWSFANLLLQAQGVAAVQEFMRVSINTTMGLAGFVDVATDMRLDRHNEDLGQTLAVWGAPDGAYLVLPFFGPSTTRDTVAFPADQYAMPASLFREPRDANAMRVMQVLNGRAQLLDAAQLLDEASIDKYAFVRDAYLQRRRNMIYNGDPPDADSDSEVQSFSAPLMQTASVRVPVHLSGRMPVPARPVDTSKFWADGPNDDVGYAPEADDAWSADVDLPLLPEHTAWQTVSTD